MTDQSTVFGQGTPNEPVKDTTIPLSIPDQVKELVGEGKKYATVEDALKAIPHAQGHISNLEKELGEMREELKGRLSLEEAVAQLKASPQPVEKPSVGMDKDALSKLVVDTVHSLETNKKASANLYEADKRMKELFGEKAQEKLIEKAKELGVSLEHMKQTASQSPTAFYNIMGIAHNTQKPPVKANSSINTEALDNTPKAKEGTYAYYNEMRRKTPSAYFSPKVQNEMHRKAKELGEAFFN